MILMNMDRKGPNETLRIYLEFAERQVQEKNEAILRCEKDRERLTQELSFLTAEVASHRDAIAKLEASNG